VHQYRFGDTFDMPAVKRLATFY